MNHGREMLVRPYSPADEARVLGMWQACKLTRPWNNPLKDIARKLENSPGLFFVGVVEDQIVATAMAGYDGHRGWVNYLAVHPAYQRNGLGTQIMKVIEERLLALGCPKINLQIRTGNTDAMRFYEKLGHSTDAAVSMGRD